MKTSFWIKKERCGCSVLSKLYNLQSSLGLLHQSGESSLVGDSDLSQDLAVQVDLSALQTVHEAGVVDAHGSNSSGNTSDPQLTEFSLLQLTANIGVSAGLHNSLLGHLEVGGLGAPVGLCQLQNFISSLARHHCAFNSCHFVILLSKVTDYL